MGIGNIGWTEFLVILAIALVFLGPRRLPGIARSLGKSLREFQKALNEVKSEIGQADQGTTEPRSYLRSLLPPYTEQPATATPASTAPLPEDAEPQATGESELTVTPRSPATIQRASERENEPQEPESGSDPDPESESDDEIGSEDEDAQGKDVP